MTKKRKVPLRKCVVTQEMLPKQSLIRVVKTREGEVSVDPTGKKNGRGAYVSKDIKVIEQAEKNGALEKHLEIKVPETIYQELRTLIEGE
ncbi:nucleic-acid-binding protein [Gracilibacillus boraciitolerans JCM 21714]|uniref:Nucleic-acid-binding protein n=1 Tax=Gracilibacillus boraciitolerans JCM 21714 TaxID=1298598 RepID=W4VEF1_9BACI|nr:YlxR family protein [Gracilibacillus boraciitolerans]GAE91577.1 nucleic-acid-binding protein [Gracilibacillus boraciitolerans JCM 21714]